MGVSAVITLGAQDVSSARLVLLGTMVLAALLLTTLYTVFAVRERLWLATVLFASNLVGTLVLNTMARVAEQTIALQWIEQSINSVTWLGFAVATGLVYAHVRTAFGVDAELGDALATSETAIP